MTIISERTTPRGGRPTKRPPTPEEFWELYKDRPAKEIAEMYHVSVWTVYGWQRKYHNVELGRDKVYDQRMTKQYAKRLLKGDVGSV